MSKLCFTLLFVLFASVLSAKTDFDDVYSSSSEELKKLREELKSVTRMVEEQLASTTTQMPKMKKHFRQHGKCNIFGCFAEMTADLNNISQILDAENVMTVSL